MSSRLSLLHKLKSTVVVTTCSVSVFTAIGIWRNDEKFYDRVLMPVVRLCSPELCHRAAVLGFKYRLFPQSKSDDPGNLKTTLLNLPLDNPIGIAAGFDKHGEAVQGLRQSGFGFVEIGSVTPEPQPGNAKPRVFRLVDDRAIINRYGFNSEGHDQVFERLSELRRSSPDIVLGVNLGKNKTSLDASADYVAGVKKFGPVADYLVINISSPNTPGLRSLQNKSELKRLLTDVLKARDSIAGSRRVPVLLKLAPDLTDAELKEIAEVISRDCRIDGLIISNTTIERDAGLKSEERSETGGLSGAPLTERSTKLIAKLHRLTGGRVPIVGVGGVFNGQDAFDKITAGASAVQLYTSLIIHGPPVVEKVKAELSQLLTANGYENVQQACGKRIEEFLR